MRLGHQPWGGGGGGGGRLDIIISIKTTQVKERRYIPFWIVWDSVIPIVSAPCQLIRKKGEKGIEVSILDS